jgi:TetR/AcrR family transcriptional regulator, transcriptional repressor for nem operon
MRRSRSDTAETRERIVSTASNMFLNKGLAAVGMRDIMGAAGLTQGGFYRHFESKEQLIAEANDAAADRILAMVEKKIVGKSQVDALETIVSIYLGQSQNKKNTYLCPLTMIGAEFSHYDQRVRDVAINGYQRLVLLIADHLPQQAKSDNLTRASGIVSTMVGAVMLANIAPDQATARSILANAKAAIPYLSRGRSGSPRNLGISPKKHHGLQDTRIAGTRGSK